MGFWQTVGTIKCVVPVLYQVNLHVGKTGLSELMLQAKRDSLASPAILCFYSAHKEQSAGNQLLRAIRISDKKHSIGLLQKLKQQFL